MRSVGGPRFFQSQRVSEEINESSKARTQDVNIHHSSAFRAVAILVLVGIFHSTSISVVEVSRVSDHVQSLTTRQLRNHSKASPQLILTAPAPTGKMKLDWQLCFVPGWELDHDQIEKCFK
jgi:hypothetical protein